MYYDKTLIDRPYQTTSNLADSGGSLARQEKIQQTIIDKVKVVGVGAILFHDIDVVHSEDVVSLIIKAKAIRYKMAK